MTIKDAFAQAFDEAFVMDAAPSGPPKNPGAANISSGNDKMGGIGSMSGDIPKNNGQMSRADHMKRYHPHGFNPETDKCSLYSAMVKNFEQMGMSKEEAEKRAAVAHGAVGVTPMGEGSPEPVDEKEGIELANQMVQQLLDKNKIADFNALAQQSRMLQTPMQVQTDEGNIEVKTTFQLACVNYLQEKAENGTGLEREEAELKLEKLANVSQNGNVTQVGVEPQLGTNESGTQNTVKKSEYIDALDKMYEARAKYDAIVDKMNKDQSGDWNKYQNELRESREAWEAAQKVVYGIEQGDVRIVDDDGKEIDVGEDKRKWANQERTVRNAGGESGGEESLSEEDQKKIDYINASLKAGNGSARFNDKADIPFIQKHFPNLKIQEDGSGFVVTQSPEEGQENPDENQEGNDIDLDGIEL